MFTVDSLRKDGYKVWVRHNRPVKEVHKFGGIVEVQLQFGGTTSVEITTPDGRNLTGEAICRNDEVYNKRLGVTIALGRAMKGVVCKKRLA